MLAMGLAAAVATTAACNSTGVLTSQHDSLTMDTSIGVVGKAAIFCVLTKLAARPTSPSRPVRLPQARSATMLGTSTEFRG
jgi:hypothetical protein